MCFVAIKECVKLIRACFIQFALYACHYLIKKIPSMFYLIMPWPMYYMVGLVCQTKTALIFFFFFFNCNYFLLFYGRKLKGMLNMVGPLDVKVRIKALGICGSDVHHFKVTCELTLLYTVNALIRDELLPSLVV